LTLPKGFVRVKLSVADKSEDEFREAVTRGEKLLRGIGEKPPRFNSDEAAARFYLSKVFERDERSSVRTLSRGTATDEAKLVPEMRLSGVQDIPLKRNRLVHFTQTQKSIPIFGSHVVVELDQDREFVDTTPSVAEITGVSSVPSVTAREALKQIEELTKTAIDINDIEPPELRFYHDDEKDKWHLAYFFKKVPAAPKDFVKNASQQEGHPKRLAASPRELHPAINYLVDAEDCTILFYYSTVPSLEIPCKCRGEDELDLIQDFWGRKGNGDYELNDPIRYIKTYDYKGGDLEKNSLPARTVFNNSYDWKNTNKAAISAHVNGSRVYDFFKSVLKRDGVDDKGMDLISVVNVTYSEDFSPAGEWHNAVWFNNRMWYGQDRDANGKLSSYSRFLDVIAHELTHGITEHTSNLVYKDQAGALNESFSDIFGIIISNWYIIGSDTNADKWNWEIGRGLGGNGLPLRDFSDPKRTNDPDHMNNYLKTNCDNGGVHTNSNIHNKAAYNVLIAKNDDGTFVFTTREVALLYYLCLCKISELATFSDVLEELVNIAKIYWAGNEKECSDKINHIRDAYLKVGIQ
jgi:bacillolysin